MRGVRLITGATGFVGGAITLELLRRTEDPLVCVVRPGRDGETPEERLRESLQNACREYDEPEMLEAARERCTAVAGDLTLPRCGVDHDRLPEIIEFWHAAASLAFEDEREEAIAAANVGGTQQAVALAQAAGVPVFNHISTAYVAGARTGMLEEALPPADAPSNNAYERTKLIAEHFVASADLPRVRIFRPSIVIGHSRTYAATAFTGLYGFIRNLRLLQEQVSQVLGDMLLHRPLRLLADGGVPINLIPIDMVAQSAVTIAHSDSDAQIFHLTNSSPPELGVGLGVVADMVGIKPPKFVSSRDELTSIDRQVDEKMLFYGSYLRSSLEFDRTNSDAVLGSDSGDFLMSLDEMKAFVSWYLDRLDQEAKAKVAV